MKQRKCLVCGKPLTNKQQKYCGPICRYKARIMKQSKGLLGDTIKNKIEVAPGKFLSPEDIKIKKNRNKSHDHFCIICGAKLSHCKKKYCSDKCSKIGTNAMTRTGERLPDLTWDYFCIDCGVPCHGAIVSRRCPSCQEEANKRNAAKSVARQAAGTARRIGAEYTCERCGRKYVLRGTGQKFCEECAPFAAVETERRRSIKYRSEHRQEINDRKRKGPFEKVCVVCGKTFIAKNSVTLTCSPECRDIRSKDSLKALNERPKEIRNAEQRRRIREMKEEMSPQEYAEYRKKLNASGRECYHRRIQEMSDEELKDYRELKKQRYETWFKKRTPEQIEARKEYERERSKRRRAAMTEEDRERNNARSRELYKEKLAKMSDEERAEYLSKRAEKARLLRKKSKKDRPS